MDLRTFPHAAISFPHLAPLFMGIDLTVVAFGGH